MALLDTDTLVREIGLLNEVQFASFANDLIAQVARSAGIPTSYFDFTLNTKNADGGIDAACTSAPATAGRIVPNPNTSYQFKSGQNKKSATLIARQDICEKPAVVSALGAGGAFVFVAGWDRAAGFARDIAQEVRALGINVADEQVAFIGATTAAELVTDFPATIAAYLDGPEQNLFTFPEWASIPTMVNPFIADQAIEAELRDLVERLGEPGATVKIRGIPGHGKTRLALEALRKSDWQSTVLYARQVEDVPAGLLSFLARRPGATCTLVVDEVDSADEESLMERLATRPDAVRLVLIGVDGVERAGSGTVRVVGLSEDALVLLMREIAAWLPEERARQLAKECRGSPKLAALLARALADSPELGDGNPIRDGVFRSELARFIRVRQNEPEWEALSLTALFTKLGWARELAGEADDVFRARHLDSATAKRSVQNLDQRYAIAPAAGRFRYVSPGLLADYLAAEQLQTWSSASLREFLEALNPALTERFTARIRRIADVPEIAEVAREVLLGRHGPFDSLAGLEAKRMSFVLSQLAGYYPDDALAALDRCIGRADIGELRAATSSRRHVVEALTTLLWPERTFERAALLLARLAVAENEAWANNATGVWKESFQTRLGRTAAGWPTRARALQRVADEYGEVGASLVADAVIAAFQTGSEHRMGNPPEDVPEMPVEAWRPKTHGEWADALEAYLSVLESIVAHGEERGVAAVGAAVGKIAADCIRLNDRVFERWIALIRAFIGRASTVRSELLHDLGDAIELAEVRSDRSDDTKAENESVAAANSTTDSSTVITQRLERLRAVEREIEGNEFGARVRAAFGLAPRYLVGSEEAHSTAGWIVALRGLAEELVTNPSLLDEIWSWLLDDRGWGRTERWFEILGEADTHRSLRERVVTMATEHGRAVAWLSLYELGWAAANGGNANLATVAVELVNRGLTDQALDLMARAGPGNGRAEALGDWVRRSRVPAGSVSRVAAFWVNELASAQLLDLLDAEFAVNEAAPVFSLLSSYLHYHKDDVNDLRVIALKALTAPVAGADYRGSDEYNWASLAKLYVAQAPIEVAVAVLDRASALHTVHYPELDDILRSASESTSREEFFQAVIAPAMGGEVISKWWARELLHDSHIALPEAAWLKDWVKADPTRRAPLLAAVVGAPIGEPTPIHAMLLREFDAYGVGSAFVARFLSGSWMGEMSDWLEVKLATAERWLEDPREEIRQWASKLVLTLRGDISRARQREAEEGVP